MKPCHLCRSELVPHPLYDPSVAMTCPRHGDFFVYRERGKEPQVIFRPFESVSNTKKVVTKAIVSPDKDQNVKWHRPRQPIRCEQTNVIFESICEAAGVLKISQSDISGHLKGLRKSVGGYTFTRVVDDGLGNISFPPRPVLPRNSSRDRMPVRCDQTGQVFESMRDAARELKIARGNLYSHLNGTRKRKSIGGYTFTKIASQEIHGL